MKTERRAETNRRKQEMKELENMSLMSFMVHHQKEPIKEIYITQGKNGKIKKRTTQNEMLLLSLTRTKCLRNYSDLQISGDGQKLMDKLVGTIQKYINKM